MGCDANTDLSSEADSAMLKPVLPAARLLAGVGLISSSEAGIGDDGQVLVVTLVDFSDDVSVRRDQ